MSRALSPCTPRTTQSNSSVRPFTQRLTPFAGRGAIIVTSELQCILRGGKLLRTASAIPRKPLLTVYHWWFDPRKSNRQLLRTSRMIQCAGISIGEVSEEKFHSEASIGKRQSSAKAVLYLLRFRYSRIVSCGRNLTGGGLNSSGAKQQNLTASRSIIHLSSLKIFLCGVKMPNGDELPHSCHPLSRVKAKGVSTRLIGTSSS